MKLQFADNEMVAVALQDPLHLGVTGDVLTQKTFFSYPTATRSTLPHSTMPKLAALQVIANCPPVTQHPGAAHTPSLPQVNNITLDPTPA